MRGHVNTVRALLMTAAPSLAVAAQLTASKLRCMCHRTIGKLSDRDYEVAALLAGYTCRKQVAVSAVTAAGIGIDPSAKR